ncbi:MAG: M1 family metallopeptidase [Saonia sp.]
MKYLFLTVLLYAGLSVTAQWQDKVDFTHADISISVHPYERTISGSVSYTFNVLEKTDSIFLDARQMQFREARLDNKSVRLFNTGETVSIKKKLKQGRQYVLSLSYTAIPKQAVYFMGWDQDVAMDSLRLKNANTSVTWEEAEKQVWTQGQGKYTSHWLPSFDDMNEKVEFDLNISFDNTYEVIANGKLKKTTEKDGLKTWSFDMENPMSSYLLAFAIGNYDTITETSANGVPIQLYYYPSDSLKVEPSYRHTARIFDFMEQEIGVPYPWQNYKQVPVRDFLYAGMENTGTTIFSDAFMIDSIAFVDKNYVNVNAHELAHQWFGNLVTEFNGNHHWLHEGFATYYALLAEKEVFGENYFYWKLYESAKQLNDLSKKNKGEALTDAKASSLTFYEKGAWALYMLRAQIGDAAFRTGIQNYLRKYQFNNVTISDFIAEMELASSKDLSEYQELWLNGTDFPFTEVKENLISSSKDLEQFFTLQWELTTSSENNEKIIQRYWDITTSNDLKRNIIARYHKSLSDDFLSRVFEYNNDIKIRQALATSLESIPDTLSTKYTSLLDDKSYVTVENALYKLWLYHPNDRATYLDQTKNTIGFNNKNVRLLWLTLALLTKGYDEEKREDYYTELFGYTSPKNPFELRLGAFQWIDEVFNFTDQNLKDLANASVHHNWQFRKFARNLLDKLLKDDNYRKRITNLSQELKGEELRYISNKLDTE